MSLEEVVGATYGPYRMRISPEKVAEYVAATGDEADRWDQHAPPGFAGALLFVVAPHFLNDARVRPFTGVLVHVDQTFTWHGPLAIGAAISVTGRVDKVRERAGRFFVTFSAEVVTEQGGPLLDAVATFLMGRGAASASAEDPGEPAVWRRELNESPMPRPRPDIGEQFPPLSKSASRIDLVKYAAASGDYNPIHFDHDAARLAGLEGIVVHGLLMAAWALQAAAGSATRPDPIAHTKLRFRNPLRPAAQAAISGSIRDVASDGADARVSLAVTAGEQQLVTGDCVVRLDGVTR
jgi:acyl dehydratase